MVDYDCDDMLEDLEAERSSGLVNYIDYLHKEHLPKATSRYDKHSNNRASGNTGCRCTDGNTASVTAPVNDRVVRLSPAQMVIACHADAELKRAFHGKRLTHSFGVMTRTKCRSKTASSLKVNPTDPVTVTPASTWRIDVGASDTWFGYPLIKAHCETDVENIGSSTMDHMLPLPRSTRREIQAYITCPYYKEVASTTIENPLFHWGKAIANFKLSLGARILRPP